MQLYIVNCLCKINYICNTLVDCSVVTEGSVVLSVYRVGQNKIPTRKFRYANCNNIFAQIFLY